MFAGVEHSYEIFEDNGIEGTEVVLSCVCSVNHEELSEELRMEL